MAGYAKGFKNQNTLNGMVFITSLTEMHPLVPKLLREQTHGHDTSLPFLAFTLLGSGLKLRGSSADRTSFRLYFRVYRSGSSEASAI
jgi:hypothetical protein